jgi:hypothetical protein
MMTGIRVDGSNNRPSAPATCATPVKTTKRSGRGSPGGTIATRSFFIGVKCEIAVNRNIVASATRGAGQPCGKDVDAHRPEEPEKKQ